MVYSVYNIHKRNKQYVKVLQTPQLENISCEQWHQGTTAPEEATLSKSGDGKPYRVRISLEDTEVALGNSLKHWTVCGNISS